MINWKQVIPRQSNTPPANGSSMQAYNGKGLHKLYSKLKNYTDAVNYLQFQITSVDSRPSRQLLSCCKMNLPGVCRRLVRQDQEHFRSACSSQTTQATCWESQWPFPWPREGWLGGHRDMAQTLLLTVQSMDKLTAEKKQKKTPKQNFSCHCLNTVSYTHLTLPTILRV